MKKIKVFIPIMIIFLIVLSITRPVIGEGSSTFVISTVEDLIEFAENCSFDKWSKGKKVILDRDIDLQNQEFDPIPIFSGSFDGQNHTIRGLLVNKKGSNYGLFRYLEKEGIIKNLKVEGAVTPKGDRSNIGGIVGYNKGKIENVTFIGHVKGKDTVGGIVGLNGVNGTITDSQVKGIIYGETKVGGISGFNTGTIENSKNSSSVNTTVEEVEIQLEDISIDIINVANLTSDSMDIGGIAGISTGHITKSENSGTIGYISHGYNIGGIAGRQSGYISECSNTGEVYGRKDIGGIVGQMEPHIDRVIPPSKIRALQNELGPFKRDMDKMINNLKAASAKMNESFNIIQKEMEDSQTHMEVLLDRIEGLIPGGSNIEDLLPDISIEDLEDLFPSEEPIFDEEYEQAREGLFTSMGKVFGQFSILINDMGGQTDALFGDMERISNRMFKMMDLMFGIIEDLNSMSLDSGKIYEDVSDKDLDKPRDGKTTSSTNHGHIKGDINVGGVAGAMGIEYELDPEQDLQVQTNFIYDAVYQTRVVITYCENKGNITSKKNNVGGIVGNSEMGYIKGAISENLIKSTDGHYIGGIAGSSSGPIVSCYSKTELEGGNYIGGISGLAKEIQNSYSMVKINESGAYVGAIAGNIEKDSKIINNFYLSEDLKGIDSISYQEKAEYISYEKLIKIKDLPSIFKEFKLEFILEDKVIKSLSFNYGDSFGEEVFPNILDRDGFYGSWEDKELGRLIFDTKKYAKYIPYTTLLESEDRRDELAIVLVEGKFKEGDSISLEEEEKFSLANNRAVESWNIEIADDGVDSHIIRYNPPKLNRNYGIYIFVNNNWEKVGTEKDGKYLVFQADGDYINIGIFEEGSNIIKYLLIILPILLIGIGGIFIYKRRKIPIG